MKADRRQLGRRMTLPLGVVNTSWSPCLPVVAAVTSAAQEARQRNSPRLVGLGRAQDDSAAYVG